MIRLTDEEITQAIENARDGFVGNAGYKAGDILAYIHTTIAKAQLKKVVEWMLDNELHPDLDGIELSGKSFLTLLEEIEE